MAAQPFLGMRGTGDWPIDPVTGLVDLRGMDWRKYILYLYPNGMAPLTAMLSMMKSEKTIDPQFHWFEQRLAERVCAITAIYSDAGLTSEITTGHVETAGVYYLKLTEANAKNFKASDSVLLRKTAVTTSDTQAKVLNVLLNGASSVVTIKILARPTADGDAIGNNYDEVMAIGSIFPEGSTMPDSLAYDAEKKYNFTQIFINSLEMTRTAMQTVLRTGASDAELKTKTLELHSIDMERAFIYNMLRSEYQGANGKPERITKGLRQWIVDEGGVVSNYSTDTDFSGLNWTEAGGGEDWIDLKLAEIFRYGSGERLCFGGYKALLAVNKLVKARGDFVFTQTTTSYGIKVTQWVTPFGVINIKTHPLMSYNTADQATMIIFDPKDIIYRYIQDTVYINGPLNKNSGYTWIDGIKDAYLTEAGLEFHHAVKCGILSGVGLNNELS